MSCQWPQCERSKTIYGILRNRVNINENPSMRALAKILRARASEYSSKFCEQIEQRPNFASTWKFLQPFDTPNQAIEETTGPFATIQDTYQSSITRSWQFQNDKLLTVLKTNFTPATTKLWAVLRLTVSSLEILFGWKPSRAFCAWKRVIFYIISTVVAKKWEKSWWQSSFNLM